LELSFEPLDPHRLLDLLTLPFGPFQGQLGARLARAVTKQPGVGGQEWILARQDVLDRLGDARARALGQVGAHDREARATAYIEDRDEAIASWLECPRAPADRAPSDHVRAVVVRVCTWLRGRVASGNVDAYAPALAEAEAFRDALARLGEGTLSRERVRQLLDSLARGAHAITRTSEESGRSAFVTHPSALLAPSPTVLVWGLVGGTEKRPPQVPWTRGEAAALAKAGVELPDPGRLLAAESNAWRRMVLAATERVVFVVPRTVRGEPTAPHPLWDEIYARLNLEPTTAVCIQRDVDAELWREEPSVVSIEQVAPLALPDGPAIWTLDPSLLDGEDSEVGTRVTSLETLATCPLSWVLEQRAGLRSGAIAKVSRGALLNGNLSHRLVEELHRNGAFALELDAFMARVDACFSDLLTKEASTLLLSGASNEREQLTRQVRNAMRALHRYLRRAEFHMGAVEEPVETESPFGTLHGRLDMRLVDAEGRDAVLDMKWGASSYRKLLEEGRAVQLAAYSRAVAKRKTRESLPPGAYFCVGSAQVLTTDARMKPPRDKLEGPTLDATWRRVEKTTHAVLGSLAQGKVPVAATRRALPILEALDVPESERHSHYTLTKPEDACRYCSYGPLCGRAWEAFQ
jgi:RecB family exonuclease